MNLALLLPLGLTALAALLIPLLLHLTRRQEQKTTPFAALRWLRGPAKPRRRIRLEQWPLLLVRLLLLAVLALLIATPVRLGESTATTDVVAVVPGVDPAQARAALAISDADWRWLQPGFPPLSAEATSGAIPVASLLRELDTELATSARLHVIAPPTLLGLDGGAIRLSREVDWQIVNSAPAPPPSTPPVPVRLLSLRTNAETPAAIYLRAAVAAANHDGVERYRVAADKADAAFAADTAAVFWLAGDPSPELLHWVEAGGTALVDAPPRDRGDVIARDAQSEPLLRAESRGRGRLLRFAAAIAPDSLPAVLDPDFPVVLFSHLQPAEAPPDRANAAALQPLAGAQRGDPAPRPLASALIVLAALLFVLERALSLFAVERRA